MIRNVLKYFHFVSKKIRQLIFTALVKMETKNYGDGLKVNHYSKVTRYTILGKNVNFNGMNISGKGTVTIGSNFHSGTECKMITDFHNYEGESIPYDDSYISKSISVEDNVWFGSHVLILGGVSIGEGAIIQAGSTVVHDIPACAIAGGHPAEVFKYRDKAHYYLLKEQGKVF